MCSCEIAEREYFKLITLPLHADLTENELNFILEAILGF